MKTKRILALFLAVVTCLSLAVSASAASISDFKDVDTKAWYAEAVSAAIDNGLLYLSVFELTHERVQNRQHTQKMKGADAHER